MCVCMSVCVLHQRAEFVNSRCALSAGHAGIGHSVGRPQVRREDGFNTARVLLDSRVVSVQGSNVFSIRAVFRETFSIVRNAWRQNVHT